MLRTRMWGMVSLWLTVAEIVISAGIHLGYGMYMYSTAVAMDAKEIFQKHTLSRARIWDYLASWYNQPNMMLADSATPASPKPKTKDVAHGPYFQGFEVAPIVLVHGIFGFGKGRLGGMSYWAGAETKDHNILVPDLGSLTSVYDRARDLFYYLKGGTIDYGEEHSICYGHSQFGKTYEIGHYPEWGEDHPVHFVGHSAGVQVVRVLQQMLAEKQFEGYENTSERWILSITSLSGALNGTTRVYLDGMQPEDGKTMKTICLLQFCRLGVILYDWLDVSWLKNYYDFGFDHFNMSWRKSGLSGLINSLLGYVGPFATEDWILPDLSIQVSVELNKTVKTFPTTYYFSYATIKTKKLFGMTVPSGLFGIHPLLFLRTLQMSQWRFPRNASPPYKGYRDEDWQDNDGALNTISMLYPRFPESHPHCWLSPEFKDGQSLQPGIWYYTIVEADHILFVVNRERAGVQFDILYDSIFERCRKQLSRVVSVPNLQATSDQFCNGIEKWPCQLSLYDHRTD